LKRVFKSQRFYSAKSRSV